MLELFELYMQDTERMEAINSDPMTCATFTALYKYVKAGNRLSDVSWFRLVNFGSLEDHLKLPVAA
jgi:hypothetical protein